MPKKIENLELPIDENLSEYLDRLVPGYSEFQVLRKSVDARRRHSPHFVYSVMVAEKGEKLVADTYPVDKIKSPKDLRPIVIGSGPAGLFAALRLVERGVPCVLFERGSQAEKRITDINRFWRYGVLSPRNNVCYGEGGAGLYSDGKLITRIKSPHIPYVLHRLVQFGAPPEIQYLSNPHVGSDKIRRVIPFLRKHLQENGCEIHYDTQVTNLIYSGSGSQVTGVQTEHGKVFHSTHVILATGHSAEDMLTHLRQSGVQLEPKAFAMGLRIEHSQKHINKIQFREFSEHPKLGSANYKLAHHDPQTGIGVYSFCMCPGGYVLSSGTEPDGLVCNGMSNFHRNSPFANAALVVSVDPVRNSELSKEIWGGMDLRKTLEQRAYQSVLRASGTKELPAQLVSDFMCGRVSKRLEKTSSPSGAVSVRLDELLPKWMTSKLREGLEKFDLSMKGFLSDQAQLYGVESRTSCPIRVSRDRNTLESLSHKGLFPCGEGAGYAGGITSAACDGVAIAEAIVQS